MSYAIDYSAAQLSGATVLAAGYVGSVRYVPTDTSSNLKFATVTEVQSQIAAGLGVALVYENGSADAAGGYAAGVKAGQAITDFAATVGIKAQGYLTQDAWLNNGVSGSQLAQYVDGAASVLGWANTGLYGFIDSHQATAALSVGARWLCGDNANVNEYVFALWQDNNFTGSVAGTVVDRNLILQPNWLQSTSLLSEDFLMALPDWQQQRIYDRVLSMSAGVTGQNFDGDQFTFEKGEHATTQSEINALQADFDTFKGNLLGWAQTVEAKLDAIAAAQAATPAAVSQVGTSLTVDQVTAAVEAGVKAVLAKTQS